VLYCDEVDDADDDEVEYDDDDDDARESCEGSNDL